MLKQFVELGFLLFLGHSDHHFRRWYASDAHGSSRRHIVRPSRSVDDDVHAAAIYLVLRHVLYLLAEEHIKADFRHHAKSCLALFRLFVRMY